MYRKKHKMHWIVYKFKIFNFGNRIKSFVLKIRKHGLVVHSAGTAPAEQVHPIAVQVMKETGIDISRHLPQNVNKFLNSEFDYVITVCDHARETCPVFTGRVKHIRHIGFVDPAEATGTEEEILAVFRKVRDEIKDRFSQFYKDNLAG